MPLITQDAASIGGAGATKREERQVASCSSGTNHGTNRKMQATLNTVQNDGSKKMEEEGQR